MQVGEDKYIMSSPKNISTSQQTVKMSQSSPLFVIQPLNNISELDMFINEHIFSVSELSIREPRIVLLIIFLAMFGYFAQNGFKSYGHRQFWNSNSKLRGPQGTFCAQDFADIYPSN